METRGDEVLEIEELFEKMLDLFENTTNILHTELEKLGQKDMQLSDLDHFLENHILKSYELAKLGKLRKSIREERRIIKNNIDMINLIKKFTDKYNNKFITRDIIQLLKEQETLKQKQENPKYKYRTNVLERLGLDEQIWESKNNS